MKDPVILLMYYSNMLGTLGKWIDFPYVLQCYIKKPLQLSRTFQRLDKKAFQ